MSDFEVRLTGPSGEQMLTPYISNLSFRSIDPGGYGSVAFDLVREVNAPDFELGSEVVVYDSETGEQVGGGRILNPGRSVSDRGGVWQVAALGEGPAHLQDKTVPYMLIDTRLDVWKGAFTSNARLQWNQGEQPGASNRTGWTFVISPGLLNAGYTGHLYYWEIEGFAGVGAPHRIEIGGFAYRDIAGNGTSTNRIQALISTTGGASSTTITDFGFITTPNIRRRQVGTHWPSGGIGGSLPVLSMLVRYLRNSPGAPPPGVGGDDDWMHLWDLRVSALRLDRNAQPITTAGTYDADPTSDYVLAHQAIIDCWARFCPRLDLANARIDETATFQHKDLVWPDGITPYGVMDKLMTNDPAFTWAVWEKQGGGKYRAEWRERDLDVRYELLSDDGYTQTSLDTQAAEDVYVVTRETGDRYWVVRSSDADSDGTGPSETVKMDPPADNASTAGEQFGAETLEASQLATATAQVTVARKVYDHYTGRWVKPYKILPGYMCRVVGVRSKVNPLNVREDDGAAVYRIASNDYSVDSGTSRLELNTPTLTEVQAISDLANA